MTLKYRVIATTLKKEPYVIYYDNKEYLEIKPIELSVIEQQKKTGLLPVIEEEK